MKRFLCLIFLFLTFFVMSCSSNANKPSNTPIHYVTSNLVGDYDVSDELSITIYYGTVLTKVQSKPAKIMILNKKDIPEANAATYDDLYDHPENYNSLELIATLEDFCYENFPLNII